MIFSLRIFALLSLLLLAGCSKSQERSVTVYVSQDQVYAEPILQEFSRKTGIQVRPVYDSEAVKTVGLVNRLLAEQNRPRCDVFWNNEELRTRQLAARNVLDTNQSWAVFGYRSRRIVVNTSRLKPEAAPHSVTELTNVIWKGRVALAYPLFGSTSTHFLALRQFWGEATWRDWCRALAANEPFQVDGNSMVVNLVGRGEAWIGLTDSDDIAAGQANNLPVAALPLTREMLLIPNTAASIRGAPHPREAMELLQYLQTGEVVDRLISAKALEGHWSADVWQPTLKPEWDTLLSDMDKSLQALKELFLR